MRRSSRQGIVYDPTPPPLYGLRLKDAQRPDDGLTTAGDQRERLLRERPASTPETKFCYTRDEGDPQATACDYLAVGKASRYGSLGTHLDRGRQALQPPTEACTNDPGNQFLVKVNGNGTFLACVVGPRFPLSTDPARPGARCGICKVSDAGIFCNELAN